MKEYSLYKKSALTRYIMSKELDHHRKVSKKDKAKSLNDFIIPFLSGLITVSSNVYFKEKNNDFFDALLYVGKDVLVFIFSYFFLTKVIVPFCKRLQHLYLVYFKKVKQKSIDEEQFVNEFNHDVNVQVYLAYSLLHDNDYAKSSDDNYKKYYLYESFYHLEKALIMMDKIFIKEHLVKLKNESIQSAHVYRIEVSFEMLSATFNVIEKSSFVNERLKNDLRNVYDKYNTLVNMFEENDILTIKKLEWTLG